MLGGDILHTAEYAEYIYIYLYLYVSYVWIHIYTPPSNVHVKQHRYFVMCNIDQRGMESKFQSLLKPEEFE